MNESIANQSRGSVVLNVIIGIAVLAGVIWLVMHCPTCY